MIIYEKVPDSIIDRLPVLKAALQEDQRVIFGYLFGGLAAGKVNPLSDVDVAVYLHNEHDLAEYKLDLFDRLTTALCTAELDMVILNTAPISLAGRIIRNKRLLVDKEPFKRHAYESLALREFFDFQIKEALMFAGRYGIGR